MGAFSTSLVESFHNSDIDLSYAKTLELRARDLALSLTPLPLLGAGLSVEYLARYSEQHSIKNLIILDQKVAGIETLGTLHPFGYQLSLPNVEITVIDHHVDQPSLECLSTGNLVLEYFRIHPDGPPPGAAIAITHGDCDSVISAAMMLRALPCNPAFGEAARAADHTFEANVIADLLQSIESFPPYGGLVPQTSTGFDGPLSPSIELSFRNLGLLLKGGNLDPSVETALNGRTAARTTWSERITRGEVTKLSHGTCVAIIHGKIRQDPYPEFLRSLLPEASLFLVFHEVPEDDDFMQVRAVAGQAFPPTASLGDESIISQDLIPGFGGRKDAGSNRRGGISFSGDPLRVAKIIDQRIGSLLQDSHSHPSPEG
jgi:hypothetical protein